MTTTTDLRSPLAKARDRFIDSPRGRAVCDPTTLRAPADQRQYLQNRIEAAFLAGVEAAKSLPRSTRS
jgi:hypothetical protein